MKKGVALALAALLTLAGCGQQPPAGSSQEERFDKIPMVMVEGELYYDTGRESQEARCGVMDGEITTAVEGWQTPDQDDQSNFGSGYGYQYGPEGTIEVNLDGVWRVFQRGSGEGKVRFGDAWFDKGYLSQETLEWLAWYNTLPLEEQLAVDAVPAELAPTGEDEEADPWGVTLTAKDVTAKGLTLVCAQTGEGPTGQLLSGQPYHLERKTGEDWEVLPRGEVIWTTEGWIIPQDDAQVEWPVNWTAIYGELEPGEYRIGKQIMDLREPGDFDEKTYYAVFVVEEP